MVRYLREILPINRQFNGLDFQQEGGAIYHEGPGPHGFEKQWWWSADEPPRKILVALSDVSPEEPETVLFINVSGPA